MTEDDRPRPFPQGPQHLCLDTMVLILWNNAGHLDLLEGLLGAAFTAEVIVEKELGQSLANHPQNHRILDAGWITAAPITDDDAIFVLQLLKLWKSGDGKDRGEAEIVALCRKYGWIAITDDKAGRSALEAAKLEYAYMTSLLVAAAACGRQGLDADKAWEIHFEVESSRAAPRIYKEKLFKTCVELVRRLWEKEGRPSWPTFVGDPRIDFLIDRADKRTPPRPVQ